MTPHRKLAQRLGRNALWSLAIVLVSLAIGMAGYVWFGKVGPAEAFANAAMILSGMGPLKQLDGTGGFLFEGVYALVSGFLFFAIAGFALAPALHHALRRFHLEDEEITRRSRS